LRYPQPDDACDYLPTKLVVIFSNASLHWVHDHPQAFQNFWKMLNSDKTKTRQLLIQCRGYGNLQRILAQLRRIIEFNEFKEYCANLNQPWYFAKPDDHLNLATTLAVQFRYFAPTPFYLPFNP
jgi:hypothetical protein